MYRTRWYRTYYFNEPSERTVVGWYHYYLPVRNYFCLLNRMVETTFRSWCMVYIEHMKYEHCRWYILYVLIHY